MSISTRRLYVATLGVFVLVAALLTSVAQYEKAEAAFRCPAPVVTIDMVSQWPRSAAAVMGSSWIEPAHRPGGGVQTQGLFYWSESTQYRWCLDGRNPKFTGHIQAWRTQLCVMFTGFRPTGLRSVKWNSQGVYWPSLAAGKRQWYRTGETTFPISTAASAKGHWQCQRRPISAPWAAISSHPQRQVWGHNDLEAAKDKAWRMRDNDAWLPFSPATDKRSGPF